MTGTRLRRVLKMPVGELRFRAGEAARTQVERAHHALRAPRWNRRDLVRILSPETIGPELRASVGAGRWNDAGVQLRSRLWNRPSRFFLDPHQAAALSSAIRTRWPAAASHAQQQGDALLSGRYDLLGYAGLSFTGPDRGTNWHLDPVSGRSAPRRFWRDVPFLAPGSGDHKVIWELNRHQYFLRLGRAHWLTGDRRYAERIVEDIQKWLEANPPLDGVNWSSMLELGFRSLSWVTALHLLLGAPAGDRRDAESPHADDAWLVDLLIGVDRQLQHVERHLSRYFSPNTHLTGEALALYVTGVALPELRHSRRWMNTGRAILLEQIERQINRDGGHVELSTCYHRYTTDFYALALMTAEVAGDAPATDAFAGALRRLASYLGAFTRPDGVVPAIGDDDGGQLWPWRGRDPLDVRDALELARTLTAPAEPPMMEETVWLAWSVRPALRDVMAAPGAHHEEPGVAPGAWFHQDADRIQDGEVHVRHFADSGYVAARTRGGDHLVFDVGPHGFLNGGHAHADALAVTLALRGRPFLVDPGTPTYTMDPEWRRRLRESSRHNTVTIGQRSSAVPLGAFQWRTRATARLDGATTNPMFLVAEGSHDGYLPGVHRRVIVYAAATGWLVLDDLWQTEATAVADVYWHFSPEWQVHRHDATTVSAVSRSGDRAWMAHDAASTQMHCGGDRLGWYSPRYGALLPACSAQMRIDAPCTRPFATVIGVGAFATAPRVESQRLGDAAVVVRVHDERGTSLTVLQPGAVPRRHLVETDGVTTDARLFQLRTEGSRCSVSIAEATRVSGAALPFAIEADAPVRDLYISVDEGVARYWSRSPAEAIRVNWRAGAVLRVVQPNAAVAFGAAPAHAATPPSSTTRIETAIGA
jgi:hypothetical protein